MVNLDQEQQQQQNQDPQPQQVQQAQVQVQLPRVHRTHKDEHISSILSKLSLREKLSTNRDIEEKNKERELKMLRYRLDPDTFPEPGSETASLITIDDTDVEDLKDPSMFSRFMAIMPDSLMQHITRENRRDREEKDKRKRDDTSKSPSDDTRTVKRRCMDGDRAE